MELVIGVLAVLVCVIMSFRELYDHDFSLEYYKDEWEKMFSDGIKVFHLITVPLWALLILPAALLILSWKILLKPILVFRIKKNK